jgi:LDH2 family malate/lactate/ureidoglycolate dehydrogenase
VGTLAVTNSYHFSALWHEVEALAEQGLVGIAVLNSKAFVVPYGASNGRTETMVPARADLVTHRGSRGGPGNSHR